MVKEDFWYNGVSAKSMGITLREPVVVGGAIPRVERVSVPGRNGDLVYFDGSYENRPAEASCFALKARNVMQSVTRVNNWLLGDFGYKELVIPEDRDHFFLATVENGAEINTKLAMLAPFEIEFSCKPQRFLNIGKKQIEIPGEAIEFKIYNPTQFESNPLLKIYGTGTLGVSFNGKITTIRNVQEWVYYDCENHNAWKDLELFNNNVYGASMDTRKLMPGENDVHAAGSTTKIEIIPRWWEL